MPKALERKLKAQAKKKGFKPGSDRYNRYVYGGLRASGWSPKSKSKSKSKRKKK